MEQGCAELEQPGARWAPLGEILPGIIPMILLDRIGRSLGLQRSCQSLDARAVLVR